MRRRPLGSTGLEVSELSLGTWGLSGDGYGGVPEADQDRLIDRSRALGVTLFETADSYAKGAMEKRLGERLAEDAAVQFATKIGTELDAPIPRKRFDREYLRQAFEHSRERLKREKIDLLLLHNPSPSTLKKGEACTALKELKAEGKILAWGVSVTTLDAARAAILQSAEVLSLQYNAFSAKLMRTLIAEVRLKKIGILAHSTLAYGLLCGLWAPGKEFAEGDHRRDRWTEAELRKRIRQLNALRPCVVGDVSSLRSAALRYVLSQDLVSSAVLGPRNIVQLDQLIREAGKAPPYLAPATVTSLEARLRGLGVEL
jgi:aryl-alcohol dehydrogenase-like predicted oxidoreductase